MIIVSNTITLNDHELQFSFTRSSGPGGQNVNKVSTAVYLRFDVKNSHSLSEEVKTRLIKLAGGKMTRDGQLLIFARRFRTQESNRQDAINRLVQLIAKAEKKPPRRIKTNPTTASKLNRILEKEALKKKKTLRKPVERSNPDEAF
ncbi:MAG: aminoacyl-tRNA hydrolase [Chitinivibrionales bacterium]|nr:aminoacyl-tRNA hydrolase [Chitinivibrionales bacterium]